MKFNLFIASVLVSQTLGFRMLRRANDWKERGLSGIERLNQIRLQREGEALIIFGSIDVGDECWRRYVLVSTLR